MAQDPRTTEAGRLSVKVPGKLVGHLDALTALTGQPRSVVIRWALARLTANDLPAGWLATRDDTRTARQVQK